MVILILIKDGKRLVYSEQGMMRLFESKAQAIKHGKDIYGENIELEATFLHAV